MRWQATVEGVQLAVAKVKHFWTRRWTGRNEESLPPAVIQASKRRTAFHRKARRLLRTWGKTGVLKGVAFFTAFLPSPEAALADD
jgi:hypothetical protein